MTCFCVNTSVFKDVDMHCARYPEEPRTTFLKCFLNDLLFCWFNVPFAPCLN